MLQKKIMKRLGRGYEKIDACHNDCILFYKEDQLKSSCNVCGENQGKRIEIRRIYHTMFFDTFPSLFGFGVSLV